ncbi:MAG: sel1 repeat family protein [Candidatus Cloacimonetes bacterium]|jgi:TPR repeat protein|nr:sel1 repeat family protein [Candidatus Cloacimonadota bacterium]MDY0326041.1 SEL1-like repeat protein [Candidatus Cloacimonadaceae bacterium]
MKVFCLALVTILLATVIYGQVADIQSLEKRANAGDVFAQWMLGYSYSIGDGVEQNYKEAKRLYLMAAENDFAPAQISLAEMYRNGNGVDQSYKEAAKWYRLAVDKEYSDAQYNLGLMYCKGQGVPQNYREGARLYRLAAEQNMAEAQNNLAILYGVGKGVVQDFEEAYFWGLLAAANSNDGAIETREIIAETLTMDQRSQIQAKAKKWLKEYDERIKEQIHKAFENNKKE